MTILRDYFGLFIFAFVMFVGGLVALPELTPAPETSLRDILGLGLAFIVIAGGFSWYYFASSSAAPDGDRRSYRRSPSSS
ncbi:MAG: hypothetical protein BRD55_08330 [Bacteroidetes bacterium SW_9_63_38]|nr:MAG: hypothetical protein BRD55_08330 [Bacteroidetes bacterium SW_9_63_38]